MNIRNISSLNDLDHHVGIDDISAPARVNPVSTAVPLRGQTSQILSSLSPKRDCPAVCPQRVESESQTYSSIIHHTSFFYGVDSRADKPIGALGGLWLPHPRFAWGGEGKGGRTLKTPPAHL